MRPDAAPAVVLRRAEPEDAAAAADVWLASFRAALPTVRLVHSDDEVRAWIAGELVAHHETRVADAGGEVVGLMALRDDWIEQLYLRPDWRGHGLGDRFVALARERMPAGIQLWCFQVNAPARRFYERNGFVATEMTDGARNSEHEPDIRYEWRPAQPSGTG